MTHPQIGRALRLMNMEKNGAPTVAEFEALLTDAGRADAFIELLQRRGAMQQIAACSNLIAAIIKRGNTPISVIASMADAMRVVLSDSELFTALFSDPAAKAALLASTALPVASVPEMTSATAPSGVVSASSFFDDMYVPWMAFDKNTATYWNTSESQTIDAGWISYRFNSPAFISKVTIAQSIGGYRIKSCDIQRSIDGTLWNTVASVTLADAAEQHIDIVAHGFYKHWRLKANSDYGGGYCVVHDLNFIGFLE